MNDNVVIVYNGEQVSVPKEVAAEIGISQAQVSRLEKSALTRIKSMI